MNVWTWIKEAIGERENERASERRECEGDELKKGSAGRIGFQTARGELFSSRTDDIAHPSRGTLL